jgi:hypothetical protein
MATTIEIPRGEGPTTCRCKTATTRVTFGATRAYASRICEGCGAVHSVSIAFGVRAKVKDWRAWWAVIDARPL